MIARLWFVLSIIWAVLMLPAIDKFGLTLALQLAFAPFVLGIIVRVLFRYVVHGPGMFRRRY